MQNMKLGCVHSFYRPAFRTSCVSQ